MNPTIMPIGLIGMLGIKGAGSASFARGETGDGILFGNGGQQNTNTSYLEFTGNTISSLFNTNTTEIAFTLRSSYGFKERGLLPSYSYRTTFDVLDNVGSMMRFQTYATTSRMIFYFTIGGKMGYYYVPA